MKRIRALVIILLILTFLLPACVGSKRIIGKQQGLGEDGNLAYHFTLEGVSGTEEVSVDEATYDAYEIWDMYP